MAHKWYEDHLSGNLVPCHWGMQPVFTLIDTGIWDEKCRELMNQALDDSRALDGFTLMLFGGIYSTDPSTIDKICIYKDYVERVSARMNSAEPGELHETVRTAMTKVVERW